MRLHVDLGRGRKEVVDVTPASTIADVLSECCRRHSLDAAEHALKQAGSTKTRVPTVLATARDARA